MEATYPSKGPTKQLAKLKKIDWILLSISADLQKIKGTINLVREGEMQGNRYFKMQRRFF